MAELEYPKIDTLYNRDGELFVNVKKLRRPEFGMIKRWSITEKIHGRNSRVTLFGNGEVIYGGKTDEAETIPELLECLMKTFSPEKMKMVFWLPNKVVPKSVTVYGEGYGPNMAPGSGIYRKDVSFRLFDCLVQSEDGNWWLERHNLEDVAGKFGIKCVPALGIIDFLPTSAEEIRGIFKSHRGRLTVVEDSGKTDSGKTDSGKTDNRKAESVLDGEGIVARTYPLLFNRKGERVMWKLKIKDFKR